MSEFKVEVIKVGPVTKHPNADRLEVAKAYDFDAVVGVGYVKEGDLAVYIPEGALVTDAILTKLGNIQLAGPNHNRVKATKIRGLLSQGLLLSLSDAKACFVPEWNADPGFEDWSEGANVADYLGIRKWDPEVDGQGDPNRVKFMAANAYYCPDKVFGFDVENIKKIRKFFTQGERVVVTEKIHGTFCQISIFADGDIVISSKGLAGRGQAISITAEEEERNVYLKVGLPIARKFLADPKGFECVKTFGSVTFLGEIYGKGVQDLDYGAAVPTFACFDVVYSLSHFETPHSAQAICDHFGIPFVPFVAVPEFDVPTIEAFAAEKSALGNNGLREGVVIRAIDDSRRKAKFINPAYLTRKGGTEYN